MGNRQPRLGDGIRSDPSHSASRSAHSRVAPKPSRLVHQLEGFAGTGFVQNYGDGRREKPVLVVQLARPSTQGAQHLVALFPIG